MTRDLEIPALVSKVERARGDALALRPLLRDLTGALAHAGVDAALEARIRKIYEERGEPAPAMRRARPGPGETYVLLYGAARSEVRLLRVTRHPDGPTSDNALGGLAASQIDASFLALTELLATAGCGVPDGLASGHRTVVDRSGPPVPVDGRSLGLSACVAFLSCWLEVAPRSDVAATAAVTSDGKLLPVEHLTEKLAALHRAFPEVTRVVVARDQPVPDSPVQTLIHADHLREALSAFGLEPDRRRLPPISPGEATRRVRALDSKHSETYDARAWSAFRQETSLLVAALRDRPEERALALAYGAQFAEHAGDHDTALALLERIDDSSFENLPPPVKARVQVIGASCTIDVDPARAVLLAESALALVDCLSPHEKRDWRGRALGTYGRALLHAGDPKAAVPLLQAAYAHHRSHRDDESPRSACYLATATRHAGDARAALDICGEARARMDLYRTDPQVRTTGIFLALEEARCLRPLRRPREALERLDLLFRATTHDGSYPRLAALREAAALHRDLGEHDLADDYLRRCLAVADDDSLGPMLHRVNAYAFGDALLAIEWGLPVGVDPAVLARGFRCLSDDSGRPAVEAALSRAIY